MKIVIAVSQITPGGGISRYICTLADILSSDVRNQVYVLTTHESESNPQLEGLIDARNIQYFSFSKFSIIKKYKEIISLLRSISPDVLINNYNATIQYILPFLSRKTRVIHIIHGITNDFYRVASINGKYVDKWVIPSPALYEAFNLYTRNKYSNQIVIIPHAVDSASFIPSKTESDVIQLTFVGVLYEHKGVLILPEIIKHLDNKGYRFHFTFIGDGILRPNLEKNLSDEINRGIVEFTGRVDSTEVYRNLQHTDIFVYPTYLDSFGLVIAEAMMNGAIPIVTCLKGITDTIVDEGVSGYLVEKGDILCFVERISYLIENVERREKMSLAAIEKANRNFSKEVMLKNYLKIISSI